MTNELPPAACPACGVPMTTGYRFGEIVVYDHARTCPDLAALVDRRNALRLAEAKHALFIRQAEVPAGKARLETFGRTWTVDADNRRAVAVARQFLKACRDGAPTRGFTLAGNPGCGKSTLTAALARSLLAIPVPVLFLNVPEELERLKGLFDGGLEDRLLAVRRATVLILDDLGRERPSAWSVDQVIYPIVNARERTGLPLICTTNETAADLLAAYSRARGERGEVPRSGKAVVDRVSSLAPWVMLAGGSRRPRELTRIEETND